MFRIHWWYDTTKRHCNTFTLSDKQQTIGALFNFPCFPTSSNNDSDSARMKPPSNESTWGRVSSSSLSNDISVLLQSCMFQVCLILSIGKHKHTATLWQHNLSLPVDNIRTLNSRYVTGSDVTELKMCALISWLITC